jgi:ribosomal-protein-alanine N-acetyltransferase
VRWKIREMEKDHIEQVMEIERASFSIPWTKEMFLYELDSSLSFHFVASRWENRRDLVLCYVIFWMFKEEVHILNLATHPAFRQRGIANSVLLFVLDFAYRRGAILYLLEVRKGNQAALRLYRKVGFASWGVRTKYYADTGEDAIIMGLFYGDRAYRSKGG